MLPSSVAGKRFSRILHRVVPGFFLFAAVAAAQQNPVPARITSPINPAKLTILNGNVHPLARPEFDRGPAPSSLPLNRMLLVLQRSPAQESALQSLLDQQQDKSSPNYHKWLTPQQFGQQFGPADSDIQTVVSWLESQGFRVDRVANGRGTIEFSGTAAQVQTAFHTEIHEYVVNAETHWANSTNPQIPAALAPVVAGIATLHNFYKKPQVFLTGERFKTTPGFPPEFSTSTGLHALSPGDFATIYNINPLYSAGINGTGTRIAVVGRSDFLTADITDFRNTFQLPSSITNIVFNGVDPGIVSTGEQLEATLDVSWAGAVAPNAQITFVVSASTNTTDGVDLSEQYIIDNDLAGVMTESFGGCEAGTTATDAALISSLAEQAAAEGITDIVSTGDSGAEGCDNPSSETVATGPISVNVLASSPYTVGVGGTEFNEGTAPSKYWNATNSASLSSAISYIPENVWNESCTSGCGTNGAGSIFAGGGGASIYFSKPVWQSAVSGIPEDGARDLPDVSLTAASHDPYLLCFQHSCESGELAGVAGTSAAAPSFAAIMALVNQKTGSSQGQANYVLYRLAAQETLSSCNGSNTSTLPASTCIFNDTTIGNNAVPGESGYGTSGAKYQSTVGYDLATGLGSVNAANLVNDWGNARSEESVVSAFSLNPTTNIQHGTTPVEFNITVAPQTGTQTPTGGVALIAQVGIDALPTPITNVTLANGSASGSTELLPGGTYTIIAHYSGDGMFLPSDSSPVQVTVTPEESSTALDIFQGSLQSPVPFSNGTYGAPFAASATVTGQTGNGTPTGNVEFLMDGGPVSSTSLSTSAQAVLPTGYFFPSPGEHSITAKYNGDSSFDSSTSDAVSITITQAPTQTTLQSSGSSGQSVTLTATVSATSSGNSPSGTVTFLSGQTQIGSAALLAQPPTGSGITIATATLPTAQLPNGQNSITAQYPGDANYQASTSLPITITAGPSFTLSANPTAISVSSPGQSGSTTLTFTAHDGFTGSATLTSSACTNLPSESTCSFSPSTLTFTSSTTSIPVTLTISTTAPSAAVPFARFTPGPSVGVPALVLLLFAATLLCALPRRRAWSAVLALAALALMTVAVGCGGGGAGAGNGGTHGNTNPGTPVGNYSGVTVTVTIAGVTQSINTLSVDVE